ncbi:S53 family peptidase [Actinacidiphila oryziradicis]|uniref:S53 family peptidase n=1 Tax=Actinacidiphila oryziradicis TaxID=2571141 RepID=UPI0023F1E0AB|nr:S53 family peptidase [Actinacidiphila oryziradicis]MCW2872486.1 peptidase [Actinacidiphila oryziradicis]
MPIVDSTPKPLLPGSDRALVVGARPVGAVDDAEPIEITLVLRRRAEIPIDLVEGLETITPEELADRYGADPADVDLVLRTAEQHGLRVTEANPAARRVRIAGTYGELRAVVEPQSLEWVESPDPHTGAPVRHRHRGGSLRIIADWQHVVVGVLGLDDRPQARSHLRRHAKSAAATSYTPLDLATVYRFPQGTDGTGQTLAILELGGGFTQRDLDQYFAGLSITPAPSVVAAGVDGGANTPQGDPNSADGEVLLDIEVAGALASGAHQIVYFAPNTDQGFVDALTTAVHTTPTPAAVSISWGSNEDSWTAQGRNAFNQGLSDAAALGVTVCVAAGDNGSGDGATDGTAHTDFPASSPYALACGGTRLDADPTTGTVASETVWNSNGAGTGGGVSDVFPLPAWQKSVGVPPGSTGVTGRGVPDVAAVADPATGYEVFVDGQRQVIGGTSAVAPLWAALTCRLVQALGHRLGLLQPLLYPGAAPGTTGPGFRDITKGGNGAYKAAPGWDACTGLGVPDGTALLNHLKSGTTT